MTAGGTKKTFCVGDETLWWSNQAYLMGTTDKVTKSKQNDEAKVPTQAPAVAAPVSKPVVASMQQLH